MRYIYDYYDNGRLKSKRKFEGGSDEEVYTIVFKKNGYIDYEKWYHWVDYKHQWLAKVYKNNIPVQINKVSSGFYKKTFWVSTFHPDKVDIGVWVSYSPHRGNIIGSDECNFTIYEGKLNTYRGYIGGDKMDNHSDSTIISKYHFKNGLKSGRCITYSGGKVEFNAIYKDGLLFSGEEDKFSDNNDTYCHVIAKDGQVLEEKWYEGSGSVVEAHGYYKEGKEYNGKFGSWDIYGNVFSFELYKEGKLHGKFKKYYRYNIRAEGQYKNGLKAGKWIYYYDDNDENGNPKIKDVIIYIEGEDYGELTQYGEDGSIIENEQ